MVHYLSVMMAVSDIFLLLDGSPEAYTKKGRAVAVPQGSRYPRVYRAVVREPWRSHRPACPRRRQGGLGSYRQLRKIFKFN